VGEDRADATASFLTPKRPADLTALDPFPNSDNGSLNGGYWPLADAFLKVFIHGNDPAFYTRSLITFTSGGTGPITGYHIVVPAVEVARIKTAARLGIGHFPENAAKLIKLNRKFLIWHNFSDQVLTPYMSVNYYKQLAKLSGGYAKLQNTVRLFGLPGSGHYSGSGDVKDAANWSCPQEDTSMLKIGESGRQAGVIE
jgi:feruloyl esterase